MVLDYHHLALKKNKKDVFDGEDLYEDEDDSPIDKFYLLVIKKGRYKNYDLVQKHFGYQNLETMLESLDRTKNTYKKRVKVTSIKSGL